MSCIVLKGSISSLLNRCAKSIIFRTANTATCSNSHRVVASEDGRTIVCWHPDIPFPYENSLPIPVREEKSNSVLKVQNVSDIYSIYKEEQAEFVRQKLMRLTYTTKHRWFPKGIHKVRRARPIERSREYL